MWIGEIFKIHICVSDNNEIILNEEDYDVIIHKKKYLSAKLLPFFSEHPFLFIGYSANDKNIQSILSDIDELISKKVRLYLISIFRNMTIKFQNT
ncbi:SIR2 family protein [Lysinibacillus sp. FSL M8-0134]|uniref:SIR2 family protein n=1 Tax=Lysinibacillus sp. FSL M8-0134 TaxID=2921717 RepID=UPI003119FFFF